ncbi:MAG: hypothetical protein VYB80_01050, partial [Actinomycetota bacterium]|nr:hypothetical protein [Actinomycetota bacterium]
SARVFMPASSPRRASSSNEMIFAIQLSPLWLPIYKNKTIFVFIPTLIFIRIRLIMKKFFSDSNGTETCI